MNVIVFGATGSIGIPVVEQALQQGHTVTAFSRHADQLEISASPNLRKVSGDVRDLATVKQAIKGQAVVIVVLGSGKSRKSTIRSEGTRTIIEAMKATGVERLICQTTLGNGDSRSNLNFFWKHIMFGWFLKQVYLDHELQESYVRESGLDWTIVRPGAFTDGALTGAYQHGFGPEAQSLKLKISRADVADFILKQIEGTQYRLQSPGLSY
ncbi:NAD(P)-binding oxidoreductase [Pontibacter sp. G13]|uniref:NAD(P)-dependent oxidoreductase n=1 Tax=Pontibacter sp. G13 TaxID=3074898 RepID=UPI0028897DC0|nr:NAD(P)-binding oxidoreductase [Pontibacter sp. G13]WNJ17693.1 NAD(P)-binding oxidoreductase [Pontibacter sp. G13]